MNKKFTLTIAGFLVICLAVVGLLVWPLVDSINNDARQTGQALAQARQQEYESSQLAIFSRELPQHQANLQALEGMMVDPGNFLPFVEFVESRAAANQVVEQINLGDVPVHGLLQFRVSAQGSFSNMTRFYRQLETGPYAASIQAISISKSQPLASDKPAPSEVAAQVTIATLVP